MIVGCLPFGMVANIIRGFAAFLVGDWWAILLLLVGICGIYMIVTRKKPKLLTTKLIGLYIIALAVLTLSHLNFIENPDNFKFSTDTMKVLENTYKNVTNFIATETSFNLSPDIGGGFIGGFLASAMVSLLTKDGTVVVSIAVIICGFIMFTGLSIYDAVKKTKNGMHSLASTIHKQSTSKVKDEDDDDDIDDEVEVTDSSVIDHREVIKREDMHMKPEVQAVTDATPSDGNVETSSVNWEYPPLSLLNKPAKGNSKENQEQIKNNIPIITKVLLDFGIESRVVSAHVGPSVTQ